VFQDGFNTGEKSDVRTGPIYGEQEIFVNFGGQLAKIVPAI
jgi:hypothetical protein